MNASQTGIQRPWMQPLLGSITLIDLTLGSLCAGAAMAQGPDRASLGRLSAALLITGLASLWFLSLKQAAPPALTEHGEARSRGV